MELALGVAVGSATQISVMVVPVMILLAWMVGKPLSLDFGEEAIGGIIQQ